jgi:hypothetical protein
MSLSVLLDVYKQNSTFKGTAEISLIEIIRMFVFVVTYFLCIMFTYVLLFVILYADFFRLLLYIYN